MKEITVFDTRLVMKDAEGFPSVYETLDWLDEMLNGYGVEHCFTLPSDEDIEKNPTATVVLHYKYKDDMLFSLIYSLFCKVHRGCDDVDLCKSLAKISGRYLSEEPVSAVSNKGGDCNGY